SIKANFLMSPPLVVAFAIAGRVDIDVDKDPIGLGRDGKPVYLRDIWPTGEELNEALATAADTAMYQRNYGHDLTRDAREWNEMYLIAQGVRTEDFNSYGARRGNHEVMVRGTFANVRIKNLMVPGVEGGVTIVDGRQMPIYDAAMQYQQRGTPLMIFAGHEYGTGSSRDWAAKGTMLLGVRAVVAKSFERIHRSNLVMMGVLPCQFKEGTDATSLKLDGSETFDLLGLESGLSPRQDVRLLIHRSSGATEEVKLTIRIDTPIEVEYYKHGGILPYVLRQILGMA
ncbi:MAG: aconitate hydratase, partial [Myxococcales bacterium]|nr:aconitate hydratase [Myxococcales bacterium]